MIDFKRLIFDFGPTKEDGFEHLGALNRQVVEFDTNVTEAAAAITSFFVKYTDEDHHLGTLSINPLIEFFGGNRVTVGLRYLLRDSSGDSQGKPDDRYEGRMEVLVIVKREESIPG